MTYAPATEIHNFNPGNTARIIESLEAARNGELREWIVYSDSSATLAITGVGTFDHLLAWPILMLDEFALDGVPIAGTGFVRVLDNAVIDGRWGTTGTWFNQHKTFSYCTANGATKTFTTDRAGDRVTLRYYDGGAAEAGQFTISVAGGTPTTITHAGTPGWRNITINESIDVGETVVLTKTSGLYFSPFAVCVWNTTGGLLLHNIGQGGSAAHTGSGDDFDVWVDDDTRETLGQVTADIAIDGDPAVVIVALGANDKMHEATDSDVAGALTTIAGRDPDADHILIAETQLNDTLVDRTTWETWLLAEYDLADLLDFPLIDQDARLGPYTQIVADGKNADSSGHLTSATLEDLGRSTGAALLTLEGETDMANGINDAGLTIMAAAYAAAADYAQLHAGDPGGAGTSNLAGGSPARQQIAWDADSDGDLSLTGTETFTGITASSAVTWISLWDSVTGGTWLGNFQLSGDQTANAAGEYELTEVTLTGTSS